MEAVARGFFLSSNFLLSYFARRGGSIFFFSLLFLSEHEDRALVIPSTFLDTSSSEKSDSPSFL